jgi:hypothetical protein
MHDVESDLCFFHGFEAIPRSPRTFPMYRTTKFDPHHLEPVRMLPRSFRPEVEILFRLEMCGVVCLLQPRPESPKTMITCSSRTFFRTSSLSSVVPVIKSTDPRPFPYHLSRLHPSLHDPLRIHVDLPLLACASSPCGFKKILLTVCLGLKGRSR